MWSQGKAGFPAAPCTRSHRVKGWGSGQPVPEEMLPVLGAPGRHHPPQPRGTEGSWALLRCRGLYQSKLHGVAESQSPLFLLSSPTVLAGCYQFTALLRQVNFLLSSFLAILLQLYRVVGWRAGRERGEDGMGCCLLYVSSCQGWLWHVCTQRCLPAQGPAPQGAAKPQLAVKMKKMNSCAA